MVIIGEQILKGGYIVNGDKENLSDATYNLTIGEILYKGEEKHSILLEPGETVCVISKEVFGGKRNNFTAVVNLRSGLTKVGILALDTGYVDATHQGPISTILVNFSNHSCHIEKSDEFFRVMFIEHDEIQGKKDSPKYNSNNPKKARQDYSRNQKDILASNFGEHFLNLDILSDRLKGEIEKSVEKNVYSNALKKIVMNNWSLTISVIVIFMMAIVFSYNIFTEEVAKKLVEDDSVISEIFYKKI